MERYQEKNQVISSYLIRCHDWIIWWPGIAIVLYLFLHVKSEGIFTNDNFEAKRLEHGWVKDFFIGFIWRYYYS